MFKTLRDAAVKAKLWAPEDDGTTPPPPAPPVTPQGGQPPVGQTPPPLSVVSPVRVATFGADPAIVEEIRSAVLRASPVLTAFMANCDVMKRAFPNDEGARMRGALAMMQNVDKTILLREMQTTVTAALQSARQGAESEKTSARDAEVGAIERQLEGVTAEIARGEEQLRQLQESLAARRSEVITLEGQRRAKDAELAQRDAAVQASFSEVERMLGAMTQTFTQL